MQTRFSRVLLFTLPVFSTMVAADSLPLKPGEYQITTEMTIRGVAGNPNGETRCVTAEHVTNPEAIFNVRPMAGFCKLGSVSIVAGKISYGADCPNTLVKVEGTVSADAFSVVRTHTPKAKGVYAVSKFQGKRLGACK